MSTEDTPPAPVRVELHAEWTGGSATHTVEYDRAQWEWMSPSQRKQMLRDAAGDFLVAAMSPSEREQMILRGTAGGFLVSYGYTVLGDDAGSEQDDQRPAPVADTTSLREQIAAVIREHDESYNYADASAEAIAAAVVAPLLAERDALAAEVQRLRAYLKHLTRLHDERDQRERKHARTLAEQERAVVNSERQITLIKQHFHKRCENLTAEVQRLRTVGGDLPGYVRWTDTTARYPGATVHRPGQPGMVPPLGSAIDDRNERAAPVLYAALGLAGEAGEVANEVKKIVRDDGALLTQARHTALVSELGDVLWYWARMLRELGITPDEVLSANVKKLRPMGQEPPADLAGLAAHDQARTPEPVDLTVVEDAIETVVEHHRDTGQLLTDAELIAAAAASETPLSETGARDAIQAARVQLGLTRAQWEEKQ